MQFLQGVDIPDVRELRFCADDDLVKVCEQTENCRRSTLLRSLGSNEIVDASSGTPCCDVCSAIIGTSCTRSRVVDKVDILQPTTLAPKRRRRAMRSVTPTMEKRLRDRLQVERDAIVDSEIGYHMLGKYVVIPDTCIDELCKRAKFIKVCDDVSSVPGLRKQFVNRLYSVVIDFFQ